MVQTDSQLKHSWQPDYSVAYLALFGIAGFIFGCVFLFYDDIFSSKTDSVFHEVVYNPRAYIEAAAGKAEDSFTVAIKRRTDTVKMFRCLASNTKEKCDTAAIRNYDTAALKKIDTALMLSSNKIDEGKIKILGKYKKYYQDVASSDSIGFKELNKVLHFNITPAIVNKWESDFPKDKNWRTGTCNVGIINYYFKDPEKLEDKIGGTTTMYAEKSVSDIEFVGKYPASGMWILLILVFCSFCFIAIATCIHLKNKVGLVFSEQNYAKPNPRQYTLICLLTASCLTLMLFVWWHSFYDDDVVKNLFFMEHLITSMTWVIGLGCLAGSFCMAGFIYTASMLSFFAKKIKESKREIEQLTAANSSATEQKATQDQQQLMFNKLAKIFQSYFVISAIILSLTVLCCGSLFSTINSLDFIKLLTDDWGYSPARNDFVYFYGALFTILLLLAYIPAKIKFSEADVWSSSTTIPPGTGNGKWYDILKNPFSQMKDVLVATSPLLVSLVQWLFDVLFK
jgi:hypothetical protein